MNSRPLLDYLTEAALSAPESIPAGADPIDLLETRLKELETRFGAPKAEPQERPDLTLSAQIEAILRRKAGTVPPPVHDRRPEEPQPVRRALVEPPPMQVHTPADTGMREAEFHKFTEAVYLIGQAAKRFIDQPEPPVRQLEPVPAGPTAQDIDALAAVLRETVSAFRSVADDLAVSAGEIRNYATRPPARRDEFHQPRRRARQDEEIEDLRDTVADLQERLDGLVGMRRRARY